jgi:hypothetical protein
MDRTPEQFTYPYVNNNGATRESLIDARKQARSALRDALIAIGDCAPHGRDYQTAPQGAYDTARQRYSEQVAALGKLCNELQDEAAFLYNEGLGRCKK